jgi:hypothetical protein
MTILNDNEIVWYKTPYGEDSACKYCGGSVDWHDCENCEDGYTDHDCGEDTCCCLNPENNVTCDVCDGEGGWYVCLSGCGKKVLTSLEVAAEKPEQTKLQSTNIVSGRVGRVWLESPGPNRWKNRSRTYQGIAEAMASQWGIP